MYNGPISFREATDQMAARLDTPTAMKYKEITAAWDAQFRRRAFFSARVAEADLLGELHSKAQSVADGRMTKAQARRLIREFFVGDGADALAALGFAPPKDARGISQLASIPRLELIVDTNVRMAQETGHYKKWESLKDVYPYGVWRVGYSKVHREAHLERDGKIYAFDHPIWRESPPGGEFNCHCRRELMTARELAASGKMPVPENVPFQPSSLGFDPGADGWQDPPFGKDVPPKVEKEATRLLEDDLRQEKASMEREAQTAKSEAEKLEESARKAEAKAEKAAGDEAKQEKAKTTRSRAKAAQEYAKGLLSVAKSFVVKIKSSVVSFAEQMVKRLEKIKGVELVDFDGYKDEEGIRQITEQLEKFSNEYNLQSPPFSRFTIERLKKGNIGTYYRGEGEEHKDKQIALNIDYLKMIPEWRKTKETDIDNSYEGMIGFMLKGQEVKCAVTHEFGHRIISEFIDRGEIKPITEYLDLVFKQHKEGWHTSYGWVGLSNEVSPYASANVEEFFAECFNVYTCGDKERLPKDIQYMVGNILRCLDKNEPMPIPRITDFTQAFKKEYARLKKNHLDIVSFGSR